MLFKLGLLIVGVALLSISIYLKIQDKVERTAALSKESLKRKKSFKEERRKYPRKETSIRIRYQTRLEEGVAWLRNISQGGACLLFMYSMKPGTPLQLKIDLPYDKEPIFAESRAVWSKGDNLGIAFEDIKKSDLDRVFQFIDNKEHLLETVHA